MCNIKYSMSLVSLAMFAPTSFHDLALKDSAESLFCTNSNCTAGMSSLSTPSSANLFLLTFCQKCFVSVAAAVSA